MITFLGFQITADFVYVRGHGPVGRYRGHYTDQTLIKWATRIRSWKKQGKDVYVYFDNHQESAAPTDALKLRQLLSEPSTFGIRPHDKNKLAIMPTMQKAMATVDAQPRA
jgi:uncharacterized protein YecE (DUF72 family)